MKPEIVKYLEDRLSNSKQLSDVYHKNISYGLKPVFKTIEEAKKYLDDYEEFLRKDEPDMSGWEIQGEKEVVGHLISYTPGEKGRLRLRECGSEVDFETKETCLVGKVESQDGTGYFYFDEERYPLDTLLSFKVYGLYTPMIARDINIYNEGDCTTRYRVHLASNPFQNIDLPVPNHWNLSKEKELAAEKAAPYFAFTDPEGYGPKMRMTLVVVGPDNKPEFVDVDVKHRITFHAEQANENGLRKTPVTNHLEEWENYKITNTK